MRGLAPVAPSRLIQEPHPELIQPILNQTAHFEANQRPVWFLSSREKDSYCHVSINKRSLSDIYSIKMLIYGTIYE